MVARSKSRQGAAKADRFEAKTTSVGRAFTMPDEAVRSLALGEEMPIDFQARQDSISPTRRAPGPKLAPKLKRTTLKPAKAKETPVKL